MLRPTQSPQICITASQIHISVYLKKVCNNNDNCLHYHTLATSQKSYIQSQRSSAVDQQNTAQEKWWSSLKISTFCFHSSILAAHLASISSLKGSGVVGGFGFLSGSSGWRSFSGWAWNSLACNINSGKILAANTSTFLSCFIHPQTVILFCLKESNDFYSTITLMHYKPSIDGFSK